MHSILSMMFGCTRGKCCSGWDHGEGDCCSMSTMDCYSMHWMQHILSIERPTRHIVYHRSARNRSWGFVSIFDGDQILCKSVVSIILSAHSIHNISINLPKWSCVERGPMMRLSPSPWSHPLQRLRRVHPVIEHQSSIGHNSDMYAATDLNTKSV